MMTINNKEQELVDEIMEGFNFRNTHHAMTLLRWRWVHSQEMNGIPSLQEIKESARKRIENAIECAKECERPNPERGYFSSSGGFKATVWINRYKQITNIELQFILNEWQAGED